MIKENVPILEYIFNKARIYLLLIIIFSVDSNKAQTFNLPFFQKADFPLLHLNRVEKHKDSTLLYFLYTADKGSIATISPNTYIEDLHTKKKYSILECEGIPFSPEQKIFSAEGVYSVIMYFPSIGDTYEFNFIESKEKSGLNIYGINLKAEAYDRSYNIYDLFSFINQQESYAQNGNIKKAIEYCNLSLQAKKYFWGSISSEVGKSLFILGSLYSQVGDNTKAIEYGEEGLIIDKENKESDEILVGDYRNLALFYEASGNIKKAIEMTDNMRKILSKKDTVNNEYGSVLNNLSYFHNIIGDYEKSLSFSKQSLKIQKLLSGEDSESYAISLSNYAKAESNLGNYTNAIEQERKSLEIRKKLFGNHDMRYEISVSRLAWYHYLAGDYKNAVAYGEENVKLWIELMGKNHEEYPGHLSDLAEYHRKNGSYQKTIDYMKEVADIYKAQYGEDVEHYGSSLMYLSNVYSDIGDFPNCISTTEETTNVYRKNNIIDGNYISVLSKLAAYYTVGNNKEKALKIADEMLIASSSINNKEGIEYAKILSNIGTIYTFIDSKKAIEYAKEAVDVFENSKEKNKNKYSFILSDASLCFSSAGDYESAISYLKKRTSLSDKSDISYSLDLKDIAINYANMKDYSKAVEYVSLSLQSLWNLINLSSDGQDPYRQYLYWNLTGRLEELIEYAYNSNTNENIALLYDEVLNIRTLRLRDGNANRLTWKDVKSHLRDNEVAIEFVNNNSLKDSVVYYYALILKKNQDYPSIIKLSDDREITKCMQIANSAYERDYNIGKVIWGRLKKEISGIKNIYFAPTFTLVAMPIEHFPINEKQNYNDIYNIYRLSSTRELVVGNKDESFYSHAVLYGGLTYENSSYGTKSLSRSGFEPLYNTQIEINEISKVLNNAGVKSTIFSGDNGTEESLRTLSGGNTDILHIATHGIDDQSYYNESSEGMNYSIIQKYEQYNQYNPNDNSHSNSFLAMSGANKKNIEGLVDTANDGLLHANEVSKLDFNNVQLLVLSACESGRGNYGTDDMMWGIQRGFKEAGVKSILMSFKKVDDEATRILMVEFYKNLMKGKTKLQSLKDAQTYLRQVDNGKYDNPDYWATFVLLDGFN